MKMKFCDAMICNPKVFCVFGVTDISSYVPRDQTFEQFLTFDSKLFSYLPVTQLSVKLTCSI